jgi:hypothetical protein
LSSASVFTASMIASPAPMTFDGQPDLIEPGFSRPRFLRKATQGW